MTYRPNVFRGTLNPTQSINRPPPAGVVAHVLFSQCRLHNVDNDLRQASASLTLVVFVRSTSRKRRFSRLNLFWQSTAPTWLHHRSFVLDWIAATAGCNLYSGLIARQDPWHGTRYLHSCGTVVQNAAELRRQLYIRCPYDNFMRFCAKFCGDRQNFDQIWRFLDFSIWRPPPSWIIKRWEFQGWEESRGSKMRSVKRLLRYGYFPIFYSTPQCSHSKPCASYSNSGRLSVCHTLVLCQKDCK